MSATTVTSFAFAPGTGLGGAQARQQARATVNGYCVPRPPARVKRAGTNFVEPQTLAIPSRCRRWLCVPVVVVTPVEPGGATASSVVVMEYGGGPIATWKLNGFGLGPPL